MAEMEDKTREFRAAIDDQIASGGRATKLMIDGVQTRDLPLVQACAMIFCATYVILLMIADMASIISNPRLRHPK